MSRDAIEAAVRAIYAARAAGDAAALLAHFAPDAAYRVVGDASACPTSTEHRGASLLAAFTALNQAMPVRSLRIASLLIEGDRAVAEIEATLAFAPTGEVFDTRWVNLFTFQGGKVTDCAEYIDTAKAARLFAGAAPR